MTTQTGTKGNLCHWCGSSHHPSNECPICEKGRLAAMGVPAEYLFDYVLDLEDLIHDH